MTRFFMISLRIAWTPHKYPFNFCGYSYIKCNRTADKGGKACCFENGEVKQRGPVLHNDIFHEQKAPLDLAPIHCNEAIIQSNS